MQATPSTSIQFQFESNGPIFDTSQIPEGAVEATVKGSDGETFTISSNSEVPLLHIIKAYQRTQLQVNSIDIKPTESEKPLNIDNLTFEDLQYLLNYKTYQGISPKGIQDAQTVASSSIS